MKNKIAVISIASIVIILLSFILLAIPGQFVGMFDSNGHLFAGEGVTIAGYEYIFHCIHPISNSIKNPFYETTGRASATGIMSLIFMFFAVSAFATSKTTNALPLLGGILETISGFFFLMTSPFAGICYPSKHNQIGALWVPYLIGSLLLLAGIAAIVISVISLREEKNEISSKKSYSYLKK